MRTRPLQYPTPLAYPLEWRGRSAERTPGSRSASNSSPARQQGEELFPIEETDAHDTNETLPVEEREQSTAQPPQETEMDETHLLSSTATRDFAVEHALSLVPVTPPRQHESHPPIEEPPEDLRRRLQDLWQSQRPDAPPHQHDIEDLGTVWSRVAAFWQLLVRGHPIREHLLIEPSEENFWNISREIAEMQRVQLTSRPPQGAALGGGVSLFPDPLDLNALVQFNAHMFYRDTSERPLVAGSRQDLEGATAGHESGGDGSEESAQQAGLSVPEERRRRTSQARERSPAAQPPQAREENVPPGGQRLDSVGGVLGAQRAEGDKSREQEEERAREEGREVEG